MSDVNGINNLLPLLKPVRAIAPAGADAAPGGGDMPQAARQFEAVLLYRLLLEMKRTIPESGLLESGITDQTMDLFFMHLADQLAQGGGMGLWRELCRSTGPAAEPGRLLEHLE